MKGKIRIFFVCSLFIVSLFSTVAVSKELSTDSSEWVLMIYLNGDNKLSAAQQQVLQQIKNVGSNEEVIFTVLIDGDQEDDTSLYYLEGTTLEQQEWTTESDMSDATTIKEFVQKVQNDIQAEKYGLMLSSNKGSGWQGVSWDDHGDGIMITMPELTEALNDITHNGADPLDIIAIETCLGGNFEVIYQLQSFCDIYVGYADCGLVGDWPYSAALAELRDNPSMTGTNFATAIIDTFNPRNVPSYKLKTAMGATDTTQVNEIKEGLNDLAMFFLDNLDSYQDEIQTALTSTRVYGQLWNINYFIDIYNFLDVLSIDSSEFQTIKTSIQSSIDTAVISKAHVDGDTCCGFNMYFPQDKRDYNNALRYESGELPSPYEETAFARDSSWDEFLKTLLQLNDNTAPLNPSINGPAKGKAGTEYEYSLVATDPDGDSLRYCIDWDDGSTEQWTDYFASGESVTVSHIWNETGTYTIKVKAKDEGQIETDWVSLETSMPHIHSKQFSVSFMILFGTIQDVENDQRQGFRFLPINVMNIGHTVEDGFYVTTMDETSGGFPCCGYIGPEDFNGIITHSFICGIWLID